MASLIHYHTYIIFCTMVLILSPFLSISSGHITWVRWFWPKQQQAQCDIPQTAVVVFGFIWKRSLNTIPISDIQSDRLCAVQLQGSSNALHSNLCLFALLKLFRWRIYQLFPGASVIDRYLDIGPVVVCGDLDVNILDPLHTPNRRILPFPLYHISELHAIGSWPYILHWLLPALNLSDHLLISISLHLCHSSTPTSLNTKININWGRVMDTDAISLYVDAISWSVADNIWAVYGWN